VADWGFAVQSTPAHFETLFPVIEELALRERVIVWVATATAGEYARLKSMANVTCMDAGWASSWGVAAAIVEDARQAWHVFREFEDEVALTEQERAALKFRKLQVVEVYYQYLNWRRMWSSNGLGRVNKGIMVSFELSPSSKALVDVGRDRGLRCIQFCHGFRNALFAETRCTDYCVLSEADRKWFVARVPPDCRVQAVGNPRLETLAQRVGPPRKRTSEEQLRLLFLSEYIGWAYTEEVRNQVLKLLQMDDGPRRGCVLRMRPHPNESRADLNAACQAQELMVDEWSSGPLEEDIRWCDAVATCCSTALIEASVCGRLCYWVNPVRLPYETLREWQTAGVGLVIDSRESWNQAVEQAISSTAAPPAITSQEHLRRMRVLADHDSSWLDRLGIADGRRDPR